VFALDDRTLVSQKIFVPNELQATVII